MIEIERILSRQASLSASCVPDSIRTSLYPPPVSLIATPPLIDRSTRTHVRLFILPLIHAPPSFPFSISPPSPLSIVSYPLCIPGFLHESKMAIRTTITLKYRRDNAMDRRQPLSIRGFNARRDAYALRQRLVPGGRSPLSFDTRFPRGSKHK